MKFNVEILSNINKQNRIDAEFFQKEYADLDGIIGTGKTIAKIASTVDLQSNGAFADIFKILNDTNPKVKPYIRSGNLGYFFLNKDDLHFISNEAHKKLWKTHTTYGDILMARKGKIGGATLIYEDDIDLNSNDNVVNIRLVDENYLPEYFLAFWNSKYGLKQIERYATGNVQPWLSMAQVRMLKTVFIEKELQIEIQKLIRTAYQKQKDSHSLYTQAQEHLERELGLDNSSLNCISNIFGTSFNELMDSKRFDSEYYNPKAKSVVKRISANKNTKVKYNFSIKNGFSWYSKKFLDNNSGEPVVRIRDIKPTYIDNEELTSIDSSYCNTINFAKSQTGDIAVGMDGLKYFYASIIEESCYINQRVCHLTPKSDSIISPEYLTFIINSSVGQSQLLRDMTIATTVGHITNQNIANLLIPIVSNEFHDNITNLVRRSIDAKKDSKILLKQAKCRVEELIEQAVEK